jgi:NAD(P)-dependent dehydrogenase (short-subunit alcohol dehydrogenase family)
LSVEGRRCLLIGGDVRDSNFCDDVVQEPSTPWLDSHSRHQRRISKASREAPTSRYFATKGAIDALTKSLIQNLVNKEIRETAGARAVPDPAETVADKPAPNAARHGHDVPMKRPGQPEEAALA